MPEMQAEQTARRTGHGETMPRRRIGVDVGGTFTDLVAAEPDGAGLRIVKVPSTPPDFHLGVIEAVGRLDDGSRAAVQAELVHGSTVATNALLQRAGEPVAFITTEGFRDMLLIGRQNRPRLYALRVERPPPITPEQNWFTLRERIDARGEVVEPLDDAAIDRLVEEIRGRGLEHAAVCFLFSFINPVHERRLGERLSAAGIGVSLSCDILPEFREYERASTTAINASLRPVVKEYLESLEIGLKDVASAPAVAPQSAAQAATVNLRIMHSGGGTLSVAEASAEAAKLILSGPAGGVIGAAFVAGAAGLSDIITYDMGGTSTDVATILDGRPQWTTGAVVDGLPIGLPMFDIHTVGAGGGSIAQLDVGGALRVGPRSAGARPGPVCYGRGGNEPTVTDANLVLGRIVPERFLGGAMRVDAEAARRAISALGRAMNKPMIETALGIVRIAEANMAHAIRAVTSRRGHDPRRFTLVSFGGAGGLHACALAEGLEIPRVLVPPYAGVLSALGMIVAPAVVDVSQTVVHLARRLGDSELATEFDRLSAAAAEQLPDARTETTELYADARFAGQSHELKVRIDRPAFDDIVREFQAAYRAQYGDLPSGRDVEVVTLRLRRIGHRPDVQLPELEPAADAAVDVELIDPHGRTCRAPALSRAQCLARERITGPLLMLDPEATMFVPPGWLVEAGQDGSIIATRR